MATATFDQQFLFENFNSAPDTGDEDETPAGLLKRGRNAENKDEESEAEDNPQEKYIKDLEEQNAKLKSIIKRMLGPQTLARNEDSAAAIPMNEDGEIDLIKKLENEIESKPFAVVLFLNNDVSSVHRKEIDEMMKTISTKKATQEVLMAQKLKAQNSAVPLKAFTANFKGRRYNPSSNKDGEEPYVVCACQYFKSFFIDRMGAPLLESNPGVTDLWDVPLYQQMFMKALPIVEEALNVRVKQIKQCFNCGGEHHLNECSQPKDMKRININRQQFSASKFNSPGFDSRKIVNEEIEERFKPFKPGQISVGLEEALGISLKTQVPAYLYKMREIGYPPGWMTPADEGLKIYNADGNIAEEPGYEEGEIKPIKLPDVINYPGFNVSLPEGVVDEAEMYGMPPYRPDLADLDIARKRAKYLGFNEPSEPVMKKLKYEDEDMEVENQISNTNGRMPPLPLIDIPSDNIIPPPPNPEKPPLPPSDDDNTVNAHKTPIKHEPISDDEATEPDKSNPATSKQSSKDPKDPKGSKSIDETTYRNWYCHEPLSSIGITYVMFTPPPLCRGEVKLENIPKNITTDLDREPWKTASASWYDPLYGDLAVPTGTYDAIRTLLKETKRPKRKPMA